MPGRDVRFFPEYRCWPLWSSVESGGEDNPDPHDLGLPSALADAVVAWSDEFDAQFDDEDFGRTIFTAPGSAEDFDRRGLDLARQVAAALGDQWSVRYHGTGSTTWLRLS